MARLMLKKDVSKKYKKTCVTMRIVYVLKVFGKACANITHTHARTHTYRFFTLACYELSIHDQHVKIHTQRAQELHDTTKRYTSLPRQSEPLKTWFFTLTNASKRKNKTPDQRIPYWLLKCTCHKHHVDVKPN